MTNLSIVMLLQGLFLLSYEALIIVAKELYPVHLLDVYLTSCTYWTIKGLYKNEENIFWAPEIVTMDWFYVLHNPIR